MSLAKGGDLAGRPNGRHGPPCPTIPIVSPSLMRKARRRLAAFGSTAFLAALVASLGACFSASSGGNTPDAGSDVVFEFDAAGDAELDATTDAAIDSAVEAAADVTLDTSSAVDSAIEATIEASNEASVDAPAEAAIEAGVTGASLYVDPVNGLDTNPGTLALPFKTIAKAASTPEPDAGAAGVTIYLADGTYDSTNQTTFWGTFNIPTFVRGSAPGHAILLGSNANEQLYFLAGGGVTNVTFRNTTNGFRCDGGTFTASGLTFDGLTGTAMSLLGNTVATIDTATVTNLPASAGQLLASCIYVDNTANVTWHGAGAITGGTGQAGACIFERGSATLAIDGLTLTNYPGWAAQMQGSESLTLTGSTITGTGPGTGPCGQSCNASIFMTSAASGAPGSTLVLSGTSITGSPGSAVAYEAENPNAVATLTMTSSHLDNNAYAGIWISTGNASNGQAIQVTATGTTFDGNAMSGITATDNATVSVTGGSVSNDGAGAAALGQTPGGIVMTGALGLNALTMRNVTMASNAGNFLTLAGPAGTTIDLGTTASVGGNTFSGVTVGAGKSVLDLTALISGTAVGNTWMPSTQGSDSNGHYTTSTTIIGPAAGLNVTAPTGASVILE